MTAVTAEMLDSPTVVRYLRTFVIVVLTVTILVVAINLAAFAVMTRPENAAVVQLMDGWSRLYKPILYDAEAPEVAIFGRSFTRDAFDPEEVGKILGMSVFNFAVSGGTAYENRRFAQSAAANANLRAIVLNLDSFDAPGGNPRERYGFDESVLNVTPDGKPNRFVGLSRASAVTLSGSAVGNNIQLFWTLARMARGATKEDVLASYERRDYAKLAGPMAEARAEIFPPVPPASTSVPLSLPVDAATSGLREFDATIDAYCDRDIDIQVYLTPSAAGACLLTPELRLRTLAYLQAKERVCRARLHLYDFQYPNAVTLEGVAAPVPVSTYYRPDGHPRPTIGLLMAPVMFKRPFPEGTPDTVKADFGVDLMNTPDPLGWWQRRLDRCDGHWTGDDAAIVTGGAVGP